MVKAAVIGSGFGGLAAAIRLAATGAQVTVFEARDMAGGRAYVHKLDGYTFDAGPTVITAPHCIEELFELAGKRMSDYVELMPVTPFYRLHWPTDNVSFDYDGDLKSQIEARSPGDVAGYERFARYAREVFEAGYRELASTPFPRFSDMVKVAPKLMKLRADRSVYGTVAKYVKDKHIREALSFHSLLVGGNPFETSSIYTLIHHLEREWGVWFPRGGTGALVQALVKLLGELGGEVRLNAPVDKITVDAAGKHTIGKETFDLVVSNADVYTTYNKLYGDERMASKLRKMDWSMSLYVLYFGTNQSYADKIAHHTVVFGPRYKELLADIFHGDKLAEDFSLYLHAPHLTDPSMAPPGKGAFYVLAPVPHLGNADLDWPALSKKYGDRILESLESLLPDLRANVTVRKEMTPIDFRDQLAAYQGSAFSVAPTLTQSAYFRPHNRDKRIPNLYLVGAGTHPGAGVPGVINGAKATCKLIEKDHRLGALAPLALAAGVL